MLIRPAWNLQVSSCQEARSYALLLSDCVDHSVHIGLRGISIESNHYGACLSSYHLGSSGSAIRALRPVCLMLWGWVSRKWNPPLNIPGFVSFPQHSGCFLAYLFLYFTCMDSFLLVSNRCWSGSKNILVIINSPQFYNGICDRSCASEWNELYPIWLVKIHWLTSTRIIWKNSVAPYKGIGRMLFSTDTWLPIFSIYLSKTKVYCFAADHEPNLGQDLTPRFLLPR